MDSELVMSVLTLLNAAMTAWQEFRHRKTAKAAKKERPSDFLKAEPKS